MNKTLITILLVLAIIVVAGGIFFAGTLYARSGLIFGWNNATAYGSGMMGQGGMMNMMAGNRGMMNGYGSNSANLTPLTIDQARTAAEKYLSSLNTSGLELGEIMLFDNHAYVLIKEGETGLGAFELLVDPVSKIAYPEHGPNMMWNLKYSGLNHQSMMQNNGGMMGGTGMINGMMNSKTWDSTTLAEVPANMTVTSEQAIEYAQKYLDKNIAGAIATNPTQLHGYYTLDFEKDGKVTGMLSVNGYTGQVFLHTWHGTFLQEEE